MARRRLCGSMEADEWVLELAQRKSKHVELISDLESQNLRCGVLYKPPSPSPTSSAPIKALLTSLKAFLMTCRADGCVERLTD